MVRRKKQTINQDQPERKTRKNKSFPISSFEESLDFASTIQKLGAGQKVRRLTVFGHLEKSPDSGPSRMLIASSRKYGIIKGHYKSEYLELTDKGKIATDNDNPDITQAKTKIELAILDINIYNSLYQKFINNKLPSHSVMADLLKDIDSDLSDEERSEVVDTFVVNLKYLGLLKTISGAERVIGPDHALENLPNRLPEHSEESETLDLVHINRDNGIDKYDSLENMCFYITPIGGEDTDDRKHSDLFLNSIVEPALEPLGLRVVRADKIAEPGIINKQIIEYIYKAKLVVVDLSYHNPNVFYEIAMRHMFRLPTVQIIRKADRIPFDLNQIRTIAIDTTDIYSLVPQIETYKSEIANQARQALNDPDSVDNPITQVFPKLKVTIN